MCFLSLVYYFFTFCLFCFFCFLSPEIKINDIGRNRKVAKNTIVKTIAKRRKKQEIKKKK